MIRIFTISTGQQIIGKVTQDDSGKLIVDDPLEIMMQPTPQGMSVGLAPYGQFAKGSVTFLPGSLLTEPVEPIEEMYNAYVKSTSGLELAAQMPAKSALIQG